MLNGAQNPPLLTIAEEAIWNGIDGSARWVSGSNQLSELSALEKRCSSVHATQSQSAKAHPERRMFKIACLSAAAQLGACSGT
eukprot:COSAG02_NODE_58425_length_277_cov_0.870787_1_plen_82_part_10